MQNKYAYISFVCSSVLMIVYDRFPLGGLFWLKLFWIAFDCMKKSFLCCCVLNLFGAPVPVLSDVATIDSLSIFGLLLFLFDCGSFWCVVDGDGNLKWTVGWRGWESQLTEEDAIERLEPHALFERGFAESGMSEKKKEQRENEIYHLDLQLKIHSLSYFGMLCIRFDLNYAYRWLCCLYCCYLHCRS